MTRRARRTHAPAFQAKLALAALPGEKTRAALAPPFEGPANRIPA